MAAFSWSWLLSFTFSRDPYLKYPLLLAYCVAEIVTGTAEFLISSYGSHQVFIHLYYIDEVGVDLLLFLMVITFTYRAMEGNPMRSTAGRALAVITVLVLGLPFLLFQQSINDFAAFFNGAGEVLNFGAAIMNLVLWTALLGATRRDAQLLTVSRRPRIAGHCASARVRNPSLAGAEASLDAGSIYDDGASGQRLHLVAGVSPTGTSGRVVHAACPRRDPSGRSLK